MLDSNKDNLKMEAMKRIINVSTFLTSWIFCRTDPAILDDRQRQRRFRIVSSCGEECGREEC